MNGRFFRSVVIIVLALLAVSVAQPYLTRCWAASASAERPRSVITIRTTLNDRLAAFAIPRR
jgi:hypothetical protein